MVRRRPRLGFGPLDPQAGYGELVRSLVHAAVMLALALA